jgi:hypothetical protein
VGSGQWAVGSGQWAVGSGQWAVGSGQWLVALLTAKMKFTLEQATKAEKGSRRIALLFL